MNDRVISFWRSGLFLISFLAGITPFHTFAEQDLQRTILALYDSRGGEEVRYSRIHRFAEMPLNHLGLKVRYHDINDPMPLLSELEDVRGVLTWFHDDKMRDPLDYINWAKQILDSGRQFVVMGNTGITEDLDRNLTPIVTMNEFLERIGFRTERDWVNLTYDIELIVNDRRMVNFERPYRGVLPSYEPLKLIAPQGRSILSARRGGDPDADSVLIAITPSGGVVSNGYAIYRDAHFNQDFWYLNPFRFFREIFETDDLPKADTTTVSGRRILYSHIDGDGWRNVSEIEAYQKKKTLAAEVILEEVIRSYPDIPVTVAPVTAELDKSWRGTDETRRIAREMFELPHVEVGTHTHSHPFQWSFYDDYTAADEIRFLEDYPDSDAAMMQRYEHAREAAATHAHSEAPDIDLDKYDVPRAFLDHPFDLELEVEGSISILRELLPEGKGVEILQWSGDTSPTERMIAAVREAGIPNINGGDSRFDREFPSHTTVSPVGRQVGNELQIYASNSNENTYTDLWQGRYFGFQHLIRTVENTETPVRLKPFNIYYHMYSGQKLSSLNALLRNLEYARRQTLTAIDTSEFARIGQGFFSVRYQRLDDMQWRILDRGRMNTIRFDNATFNAVDYARSSGVVGHNHYQGSLYVALDSTVETPVVALKGIQFAGSASPANRPYLVSSSWQVGSLTIKDTVLGFEARGYGLGEFEWATGRPGVQHFLNVTRGGDIIETRPVETDADGVLRFKIDASAIEPLQIWLSGPGGS